MTKVKVLLVKYDMDKTKKRNRKNLLVNSKTEEDVIAQLEKIHKGEKVISIHEIVWDETQIAKTEKREESRKNNVNTGEIKFYDDVKGFGFIKPDNSSIDDLFFHSSALGGEMVNDADLVEFEIGEGPQGPCAIHIKLL